MSLFVSRCALEAAARWGGGISPVPVSRLVGGLCGRNFSSSPSKPSESNEVTAWQTRGGANDLTVVQASVSVSESERSGDFVVTHHYTCKWHGSTDKEVPNSEAVRQIAQSTADRLATEVHRTAHDVLRKLGYPEIPKDEKIY